VTAGLIQPTFLDCAEKPFAFTLNMFLPSTRVSTIPAFIALGSPGEINKLINPHFMVVSKIVMLCSFLRFDMSFPSFVKKKTYPIYKIYYIFKPSKFD